MTEYTDIVIGAGASGCVLADRLSKDMSRRVLLIEAGPDYPDESILPRTLRDGFTPDLVSHDWGIVIIGNPSGPMPAPRGRVVGGSSATNSCIALRPEPADFDEWHRRVGFGWDWTAALRGFKTIENDLDCSDDFHGNSGPLPIRRWGQEELLDVSRSFLKACSQEGFALVADLNAPHTSGAGVLPMNMIDGERQSAAAAFLRQARSRPNLTIVPNTVVERITFDGNRASGVALEEGSEVRGERIILAAGAYGSPAILLRSGIGSRVDLNGWGIPQVIELGGVGKNLSDHPQCFVAVEAVPGTVDPTVPCAQVLLRYSSAGTDHVNDMQLSVLNRVNLHDFDPRTAARVGDAEAFMIMVQLERPNGRGQVKLRSRSVGDLPLVELDYCADREDLARLREGIRLGWKMLHGPDLGPYVARIVELTEDVVSDDLALDRYIREHVLTSHHPTGTAKMGLASDVLAVVDNLGRVLGTQELWVGDASIIPFPVRANTHLTCLMVADMIADNILAENGRHGA